MHSAILSRSTMLMKARRLFLQILEKNFAQSELNQNSICWAIIQQSGQSVWDPCIIFGIGIEMDSAFRSRWLVR